MQRECQRNLESFVQGIDGVHEIVPTIWLPLFRLIKQVQRGLGVPSTGPRAIPSVRDCGHRAGPGGSSSHLRGRGLRYCLHSTPSHPASQGTAP